MQDNRRGPEYFSRGFRGLPALQAAEAGGSSEAKENFAKFLYLSETN